MRCCCWATSSGGKGVIAASAGNHSQGLSYHGTRLDVPVTIVMPSTTPTVKVMQTESVGGNVVLHGETFDEAYAYARELEVKRGLTFVHPFDDANVAAGGGHRGPGNAGGCSRPRLFRHPDRRGRADFRHGNGRASAQARAWRWWASKRSCSLPCTTASTAARNLAGAIRWRRYRGQGTGRVYRGYHRRTS